MMPRPRPVADGNAAMLYRFTATATATACACLGLQLLCATSAAAADNYSASYTDVQGQPLGTASSTLDGLLRGVGAVPIPAGRVQSFGLSLRGVAAGLDGVATPLSASTVYSGQLQLPATGASAQFTDTSWSGVMDQVRRFLLQGSEAQRLQRESARVSPFDPVAGNPGSLMARRVAADFDSAFLPFASNLTDGPVQVAQVGGLPAGAVRGPLPTLPGLGVQLGLLRDNGLSETSLTVPLSMTFRSDLDPRRQFAVSLPFTVSSVGGARAVQGALATSLRLPLGKDWSLAGSAAYAMVSAKDLGSAGKIGSLSLTSSYVLRGNSGDLAIGNMIGHYRTLGGRLNGIDTGSGIANTVLRNGLLWSMPAPSWLGFGRSVEMRFVNTHYTGTALYLRNYSELGLDVGSNRRADSTRGYMQGGVSLLLSSKTTGVMAHFGSWF